MDLVQVYYATIPIVEWQEYDDAKLKEAPEWDPILKRAQEKHERILKETQVNIERLSEKDNPPNCYPNLKSSKEKLEKLQKETDATIETEALNSWKYDITQTPSEVEIWTKRLPLEILRQRNLREVTFCFEGGHDEGGIESCSFVNADGSEGKVEDWSEIYGEDGFIAAKENSNTYLNIDYANNHPLRGTARTDTRFALNQTLKDVRESKILNMTDVSWSGRYGLFDKGEPLTYPISCQFGGFALDNWTHGTLTYKVNGDDGSAEMEWDQPLPATAKRTYPDEGGTIWEHSADLA